MAKQVQPFEISTAGALRERFLAQMPEGTRLERAQVAQLAADTRGWCAIDAPYFRPAQALGRIGSSFETREPLRVVVDLLVPPKGRAVVAAVEVLSGAEAPTGRRELEEGVAVDFGELMIARTGALARLWRVGGARCGANLLHTSDALGSKTTTPPQLAAAVKALEAQGLELTQQGPLQHWHLVGPVSDQQLALATEALTKLGKHVKLNVNQPHTGALVREALATAVAAPLLETGETFGVVLRPGFGNGRYFWDELLAGPRVVGHRMAFLGPEG